MRDLTVVLSTIDRSPRPNYLNATLQNLIRGGLATATRISDFVVVNSGGPTTWPDASFNALCVGAWERSGLHNPRPRIYSPAIGERRSANVNTATALIEGARTGAPWILFLEDDIDVCADFIDGVASWLDDHQDPDRRVFSFGVAYLQVGTVAACGKTSWQYPIKGFFGTQAFAVRRDDAYDLAQWLCECASRRGVLAQYDLLMKEWAVARWPAIEYFLASAPSFVQHIGHQSSITSDRPVHVFASWPGPLWSYTRTKRSMDWKSDAF